MQEEAKGEGWLSGSVFLGGPAYSARRVRGGVPIVHPWCLPGKPIGEDEAG